MAWLILIPVTMLFCIGSYLSYNPTYNRTSWFTPVCMLLSVSVAGCWGIALRLLETKEQIFKYNLVWDTLAVTAYVILPLIISGVRVPLLTLVGALIVLFGLFLVQWSSHG